MRIARNRAYSSAGLAKSRQLYQCRDTKLDMTVRSRAFLRSAGTRFALRGVSRRVRHPPCRRASTRTCSGLPADTCADSWRIGSCYAENMPIRNMDMFCCANREAAHAGVADDRAHEIFIALPLFFGPNLMPRYSAQCVHQAPASIPRSLESYRGPVTPSLASTRT